MNKKKLLALLMALVMTLTLVPVTAFADDVTPSASTTDYYGQPLPAGPEINGDVINVNAANAQYVLDGAYGDINGKTINFTETIDYVIELARTTKYAGSNTTVEGKRYSRTLSDVTFKAEPNVTLAGFTYSIGHQYTDGLDYVTGSKVTSTNDGYYKATTLQNITFKGLTINGKIGLMCDNGYGTISGITIDGCTINSNEYGLHFNNTSISSSAYGTVTVIDSKITAVGHGVYVNGAGDRVEIRNSCIVSTGTNCGNAVNIQRSTKTGASPFTVIDGNYLKTEKYTVNLAGFSSSEFTFSGNAVVAGSRGHLGHFKGDASGNFWAPQGTTLTESNTVTTTLSSPIADTGAEQGENEITCSSTFDTALLNTSADKWVILSNSASAPVAQIDDTPYPTLAAAVAEAQNNDVITLLADCPAATVSDGKNITFALNGHKLSGNQWVIGNATLTIDGTVENSEFYGCICVGYATNDNGNVVLNGGYYHCGNNNTVLHINGTCLNSNVTISNATIESLNDNGIQLNGSGTFVIENSEITGATGVYVKSGVLTITDSKITGNMSPAKYDYYGNGAYATGDAIVIDSCNYPGGAPTVMIGAGNTFTGTKKQVGYYEALGSGTKLTSGHVYANEAYSLSTNVVKGWVTNNGDNASAYSKTIDAVQAVAQIGDVKYPTLAAAVAEAQDDNIITLLADCPAATVSGGKNITFALNGHKLSGNQWVIGNATLTIDGTVANSEFYGCICVGKATNNNGNVVLNGGYYHCGNNNTVLHINGTCLNSNVTISNATIESLNDNGIQLNGKGTFVISGSTITGATGVYVKSGDLTITNSTITGNKNPVDYSYNGNGANATGDAIVIDNCNYPGGAATVKIGEGNNISGTKNAVGYYVFNSSEEGTVLADQAYSLSTNEPARGWVTNGNETYRVKIGNLTPVAEVNGTEYYTLEAATAAAPSGAIVKLIANIDYSGIYYKRNARDTSGGEHSIDLRNLTLDMDGYSISTINGTVVFGGDGATIKNGTFKLVHKSTNGTNQAGSYALIIDNNVNTHGASGTVRVENVTCEGGINLCSADVTLDNVTARTTESKYYAVWAETDAKVTILGGTYTDEQTGGKGVLATGTGDEGGAKIYVTGGNYNGSNQLVYTYEAGSIQITGGVFNIDPSEHVADGYEAVANQPTEGKWKVGKIVEIEVATPVEIEDNNVTYEQYSQTKKIVDENTDAAIGVSNNITVNVKPTTAESKTIAPVALNKITTDAKAALVKAAVAEAPNNVDNAIVNVTIQVAKEKDTESSTANAVVYNVHPQAIIQVQGSETSTTVELTNGQISAGHSFDFYLDVSSLDVQTGEQVAVNHIHEDGTEESLGWRSVGSARTVSVTGITSFSEFKVQKITTTEASVNFEGASLRRRVKLQGGNETNEVVNTSADIRMEYTWTLPTGAVIDKAHSYFQWRAVGSSNWHKVAIANCSATGANLVLVGVKRGQFSVEIETEIHIAYKIGGDPYVLAGTYTGVNDRRSVETTAFKLINTDGVTDNWKDYAKYLLTGYGEHPYNIISYTIVRDEVTNAITGYEKTEETN